MAITRRVWGRLKKLLKIKRVDPTESALERKKDEFENLLLWRSGALVHRQIGVYRRQRHPS